MTMMKLTLLAVLASGLAHRNTIRAGSSSLLPTVGLGITAIIPAGGIVRSRKSRRKMSIA